MTRSNIAITALLVACVASHSWAARIAVVHGHQTTFRESADAVSRALRQSGHECAVFGLDSGPRDEQIESAARHLSSFEPQVIACAGAMATEVALAATADTPVVAFMVPNLLDAPFVAADHPERARVAAVAADADPGQLFAWMQLLDPDRTRIGVLHSGRTEKTVAALRSAARTRGINITAIRASDDAFPDAINALDTGNCDGVLMIPDAAVYNAPNVKRLLLWGIRQRKSVWAFSESIVKAGALAGQYPDTESVARHATRIIQQVLDGQKPGALPIQYVPDPCQAVNERTAEMIDLSLRPNAIGPGTVHFGDDQ